MSVERAEYVATFAAQTPFDIEKAREAVEKAGFSYKGMELVARGQVVSVEREGGRTEWLLKDLKAGMVIRLIGKKEHAAFEKLLTSASNNTLPNNIQVRGRVVETSEASKIAKQVDAQFTVMLTSFEAAKEAVIPPLVPQKSQEKKKTKDDSWF